MQSKNDCKSFRDTKKSCKLKRPNGEETVVEVNRIIHGALNAFSLRTGMAVDYEKALAYPLNPCPLSLCHADGKKRSTKKSALKDILLKPAVSLTPQTLLSTSKTAVVIDMMGLIRTLTSLRDTYRDLAELFYHVTTTRI